MKTLINLCISLFCGLLVACGGGGGSNESNDIQSPVALNFTTPPIELPGIGANYAENVRYGGGERNVFDIYLPDCAAPTALVIYIHGGGFTSGDKRSGHWEPDSIRDFLDSCVAYATINYSLLKVPSAADNTDSIVSQGGLLTPLRDIARALQFMRHHSASLNLDPARVAVFGTSSGAGASLWLGTHDDMADPNNADPILRQSTRVTAVGALSTQSTYDMLQWEDILLPLTEQHTEDLGGTDIFSVMAAIGATNYMLTLLGVSQLEDLFTPANAAYRANVDMLGLMDAGDAPIFIHNVVSASGNLLSPVLHHGLHAIALKTRADQVGLESVVYVDDVGFEFVDPSGEELNAFLLRHIR